MKTKKELRKEILQIRDHLTLEERQIKSHQIAERVIAQKGFIEADIILLFASYKSEVDTSEILRVALDSGKDVYYPKVIGKEMEFYQVQKEEELLEGYRGIREPESNPEKKFTPQPYDKICVIMPGAVFDKAGNRIGYGGGYYDKYLHQLSKDIQTKESCVEKPYKLAVAFECQLVEVGQIASEQHDIKLNCIVGESCVIEIS